ncbi:hypothetical protein [Haloferula sp.]|uniref:hypothetical protein n=1 Tax=Haloferula sp. TaxID=2497595 RepID=UPI00329BB4AC
MNYFRCVAAITVLLGAAPLWATSVVLDQIGDELIYDPSSEMSPSVSQVFTDFPDFSSIALDDFAVAASELRLESIEALVRAGNGFSSFSLVEEFQLSIFTGSSPDGSTLEGDVANLLFDPGDFSVTVTQIGSTDVALISLSTNIVLPSAGSYSVGLASVASNSGAGTFYVLNNGQSSPGLPGNSDGIFLNPDQGFGGDAVTGTNFDFAYRVTATAVPEPAGGSLLAVGLLGLVFHRRMPKGRRPAVGTGSTS